jgi:hypothetical protein
MINSQLAIPLMNDDDLLACTRELVGHSCDVEAELLLYLGEIDERKLFAERAFPSMAAFCIKELGFSEGAAYNRIGVARAARHLPAILDALRSGAVHLAGLRVLVPHLGEDNHERLLAEAAGKSKREIEEIAARLAPKPNVPDSMRKLPARPAPSLFEPLAGSEPPSPDRIASMSPPPPVAPAVREERRPVITPLSEDTFRIQFTAPRALRDKLRQAQDLLRHRIRSGELAAVIETALDVLIDKVKKERFAVGRRPRKQSAPVPTVSGSRHIPDAIKRAVYERAEGRCEFVDESGRRCIEMGALEFDHIDGFARTHIHSVDSIRVTCRGHNLHAAEQLYGRAYMERVHRQIREIREARASAPAKTALPTIPVTVCPGASPQRSLF